MNWSSVRLASASLAVKEPLRGAQWLTTIAGNILPDSTAAPAIVGQQKELQKHMRKDSLEQKLQQRPKPEDLIREGILEKDEDPRKDAE